MIKLLFQNQGGGIFVQKKSLRLKTTKALLWGFLFYLLLLLSFFPFLVADNYKNQPPNSFPIRMKIVNQFRHNNSYVSQNRNSSLRNMNAFIILLKKREKIRQFSTSSGKLFQAKEGNEVGVRSSEGGTSTNREIKSTLKVCKNCKKTYDPKLNTDTSCVYHPGHYSGRLNRINDVDTSDLEYFHSCCGEYDKTDPGCVQSKHVSYDEEEMGWVSKATGKRYL